MSFRINTNVASLAAQTSATKNNSSLDSSLAKLSSGLRINNAADDASGMSIADSLRSQASALGQAINNANDGIAIAQIADQAMDEQISILDTIKTKATQAAQDGQSTASREALQADISALVDSLDNIAATTSFNGKALLSGQFTNASFQVGAYSNETVDMSIGATSSDKIGQTRFETSAMGSTSGTATVTFTNAAGTATAFETVTIGENAGEGIGVLAEVINKNSDTTGVSASWSLTATGTGTITGATTTAPIVINGTTVAATGLEIEDNDANGVLVSAINDYSDTTGVTASTDARGRLELTSSDGRAIVVTGLGAEAKIADETYTGRLTLSSAGASDIQMKITGDAADLSTDDTNAKQASIGLREMMGALDSDTAEAMGAFTDANVIGAGKELTAGVTTYAGAQAMMKIAQSAQEGLDSIRAGIGSIQNQMTSTINNISVTQVNVLSAESNIRDVDFASESAAFSKYNILAQSGTYAMSQANSVQQNVLSLLQ